jgi:uncharacterized membrane protein HdeD (DUF308 family)
MLIILAYLFPTICVIASAVLLWGRREGWGWFLLVAALSFPAARVLQPALS